MTDEQAKELTTEVFEAIKNATTNTQIEAVLSGRLIVNKIDAESYPFLSFKLTKEEIEQLYQLGILNTDGNLINAFSKRKDLTTTEKLLYSVLWKNGDLKKLKHIVQGIKNVEEDTTEKEDGLVFYQFGKFLTKTGQPIIDQHVLRAFGVYQAADIIDIAALRLKETVNKNDKELIEDYKSWLNSDELTSELKNQPNYSYHIDQLLFAHGKSIKKRKTKN